VSFLWLVRDSDDLVNWCRCEQGLVGRLPQLDCPWCGCGWLFSCVACRKCFTFARAEQVDGTLEDLARIDFERSWKRVPSTKELTEAIESIAWMIEDLEESQRVVVFDGLIIPADHDGEVEFEGWHSRHALPWLPHTRALEDPRVEEDILSNPEYWRAGELPHD